jgi:hypothetical protein
MLGYDPKVNLTHWPMPMGRFGLNPYGDPLYRIIFAPSRRNLAGDAGDFRWVPTYRAIGAKWVLERWHDPWKFSQCTKESWDRQLAHILGPYPSRGEYAHVHTFEVVQPPDCDLGKLISWIEEGQKRSYQDNLDALKGQYADEEAANRAKQLAIIDDAHPAFGTTAIASARVARGTKAPKVRRSANELGMPTAPKFQQVR